MGLHLLPWMYIASAVMSAALVFLYSWLQRIFPLRRVIVAIAPCMLMPLLLLVLLRWGSACFLPGSYFGLSAAAMGRCPLCSQRSQHLHRR